MPKSPEELTAIFSSPEEINHKADMAMLKGISNRFPVETDRFILELHNPYVDKKAFTHKEEKDAIMNTKSLTYPIRGSVVLRDKRTNEVIDKLDKFVLGDTYHVSNKHTLIYKGNNYSVANLIQLREGVYTLQKNDGAIETNFNTGKGGSFNLSIDPSTYKMYFSSINGTASKKPVAPLLTSVFKLSEGMITNYIPKDIWEANKKYTTGAEASGLINTLYENMVDKRTRLASPNASQDEKCEAIKARFHEQTLDVETTEVTLGKGFGTTEPETILLALKKLINVYKGVTPKDNRDSLQFKRVQNLPDYITRRFKEGKLHPTVAKAVNKITRDLDKMKDAKNINLRTLLHPRPFASVYTDFINTSSLCTTPDETNALESLENVGKVTVISPTEGGMKDERQAGVDTRNVHPSHLGIIDPSRTPESSMAGLDQRFTITAHRDDAGKMYARAVDAKTGKIVYLSSHELMTKKVGFPGQEHGNEPMVTAQVNGEFATIPRKEVEYWIPSGTDLYTVTTNLVPFLNSNHPGRLTMAGKALPQALSLVHREAPLVQTLSHAGVPYIDHFGKIISTVAPTDGVVTHVSDEEVHIKGDDGEHRVVDLVKNLPFNRKGFHDDEAPKVAVGDKVTAGQILADNNYTKNGQLAIGKNLYAAYIPYKGFNHEDGIVISESASKAMASHHAYKYKYKVVKGVTIADKKKFLHNFNGTMTVQQADKLDDRGFVKKGVILTKGDPIYAVLETRALTDADKVFNRVSKQLFNPYSQIIEHWDHEEPGEVVEASVESQDVHIVIRSEKDLVRGDKLTGLHGNKGIVSLVLKDDEMPHSETTGKSVDILLNPASVTSRINLGQIHETAAAKLAAKMGTPYQMKNYDHENNLTHLISELGKHGVSDTDVITQKDSATGQKVVIGDKVLAGPQYFIKLNKTTEEAYSVRGIGKDLRYDNNAQPSKGGEDGSKSIGYQEFLGLLGSNARANLKEIGTVKSEGGKNSSTSQYWEEFLKGSGALPAMKTTFATKKFMSYLQGCGINVRKEKTNTGEFVLKAAPMTDADVLNLSGGREITKPELLRAESKSSDLSPVKGGLLDYTATGGPEGTMWSHYKLAEPMLNPNLEEPVKKILGIKKDEFDNIVSGKYGVVKAGEGVFHLVNTHNYGELVRPIYTNVKAIPNLIKKAEQAAEGDPMVSGEAFAAMLKDINVEQESKDLAEMIANPKAKNKDNLIAKLKSLRGLANAGDGQLDKTVVMNYMPVIPPSMRPFTKTDREISWSDVNKLYKTHLGINQAMQKIFDGFGGKDQVTPNMHGMTDIRTEVYNGAKAIMAAGGPTTSNDKRQNVKGLMEQITGVSSPKEGYFQERLLKRRQDLSGRGTIFASPDIKFNEAKFPKDMLWELYKPHIIRDLTKNRLYSLAQARESYEKRDIISTISFGEAIKKIPVLLNRNPTLMRTNIMALRPVPIDGKTIGLNPLHLPGYAADYDGDALSAFVPLTEKAIKEANEKLLPEHHMHDARMGFGNPMFAPGHEAILGSVHLTTPDMEQEVHEFHSEADALKALSEGKIKDNTPIKIVGNGG